jgi:YD repeat-containing protein
MKLRLLIVLYCFFIGVQSSLGQSSNHAYFVPNVFPKSPRAAAIDKYGDYPVNEFSGVPEISIPLYEVVSGGFKVPVTLSYHASGIKVNEKAGWVGLGWGVLTGGQITRRVMGGADEGAQGYLTGKLDASVNVNQETLEGLQYLSNVKSKEYDTEPDIFTYSFGSKNGKFFFNGKDNFKVTMVPFSPIAVKPALPWLTSFDIQDELGNKYSFGKTAKETTYGSKTNTSSWLLESMISQNNRDTVNFSYNDQDRVTIPDFTEIWTVEDNVSNYDVSNPVYAPNPHVGVGIDNSSLIDQRLLKQIDFSGGKVVFELANALREDIAAGKYALNAIKVYTYDHSTSQFKLLKSIQFYTSYFIAGTDVMSKRLRLDSLTVQSGSGEIIEKYRFEYNTDYILPPYSSSSIDYWGYYNGKGNSTLIPQMTVPYNLNNITIGSGDPNSREPDNNFMQACMLKRINYPAGGYTDFEFEANRYINELGALKLAGGLRVKTVRSAAGYKSKPVVKTYEYLSARPNFFLKSHFFTISQTERLFQFSPNFLCPITAGRKNVTSYVSSPTIDIEPYDAVPVAYAKVREYFGDGVANTGKIEYQFSDRSDALQTASLTGTPVINSFFFVRGQLLNKTQYLRAGNNYRKVSEDSYQYSAFPETHYDRVGFVVGKRIISDEPGAGDVSLGPRTGNCAEYHDSYSFSFSSYSITSDDNYLTESSNITYDPDDQTKLLTVTKSYKYDNFAHQQITRAISTDSKGNTITQTSKYPSDFLAGSNTTTGNAVIDTMLRRNMLATLIEKSTSIAGSEGLSGTYVKGAELINYKLLPSKAVEIDKHQQLKVGSLISNFSPAIVNAGLLSTDTRYTPLVTMDAYDANSNVSQYTARNAPSVAVIWDYYGKSAIAQVTNAAVSDIAYTSFEADRKGNWSFSGLPVINATAVTGKRVYNLSSGQISATGISNANVYIVSYWSRGGAASVNGTAAVAGINTNGWTYFEHKIPAGTTTIQITGNITIDELRLFPQKAHMTTYTYDPGIGLTSICSPLNIITYYDYDSAGRLKAERDGNRNITKTFDYHQKN